MVKETKVYDYKPELVQDALLGAFKKRKGEATAADLVAMTGLPSYQVETEIRSVSDEFGARLRVTESGEMLYSFPSGMKSRYRGFVPGLKRFLRGFFKGIGIAATFFFKVWIAVMLVGYFLLFILLAILALVASVAVSASDKGSSRKSKSIFGVGRIFELIIRLWFYGELTKDPRQRMHEADRRTDKKPLHKSVYSFVFGDGDDEALWNTALKKRFVAFAQARRGIVVLEEFMALTGLDPSAAEDAINRYLYEFEGSPEVTQEGTIYYSFPELLKTNEVPRSGEGAIRLRPVPAFSSNPKKTNVIFCLINGVNLAFGGYFLWASMAVMGAVEQTAAIGFYAFVYKLIEHYLTIEPYGLLLVGLGIVPLAFAALFYLVPFLRSLSHKRAAERVKMENLRRFVYGRAWDGNARLSSTDFTVSDASAQPSDPKALEKVLDGLAAYEGADVEASESAAGGNGTVFVFNEIQRKRKDVAAARMSVDPSATALGDIVFDSLS